MNRQRSSLPRFKFAQPPDIVVPEDKTETKLDETLAKKIKENNPSPKKKSNPKHVDLDPFGKSRKWLQPFTIEEETVAPKSPSEKRQTTPSPENVKKFTKSKSFDQKIEIKKPTTATSVKETTPAKKSVGFKRPKLDERKPSKESGIPIMTQKIKMINDILKEHAQKSNLINSKSCHEINNEKITKLIRTEDEQERKSDEVKIEETPKNVKGAASEPSKRMTSKRSLSCPEKKKDPASTKTIDFHKKPENEKASGKNSQKRVTHTDQLINSKLKTPQAKDEVLEKKMTSINEVLRVKPEVLKKALEEVQSSQPSTPFSWEDSTIGSSSSNSNVAKKAKTEKKDLMQMKDDKTKATRAAELRDLAAQAMRDHKVFCIFDSHWYIVAPVREELLSRGWLEVMPDRRLIPKRRPPPPGPVSDRDMTSDHVVKAILTARENLIDEIEKVPKSSPSQKKPKTSTTAVQKPSEESLAEAVSDFRIVPPTNEKRKNNLEIREFVARAKSTTDRIPERSRSREIFKYKSAINNYNQKGKNSSDCSSDNHNESSDEVKSSPIYQFNFDPLRDNKFLYDPLASRKLLRLKSQDGGMNNGIKIKNLLTENESKLVSKIIQSSNGRINFMWLSIKPGIHLKCFNYSPEIINKFQKTTFCTKIGLWNHLNEIRWYAHEVSHPAKSPRMYNTGEEDDLQAFFQDFQITACLGLLKWLSETFLDKGPKAIVSKKGKVPLKAFEFAIKQCENYVKFRENEDLTMSEESKSLQEDWNTFLQWFYIITNEHGKVQESSNGQLLVLYTKALDTLKTMKKHWPEMDIDGRLNIWIMKPYCASCGRGIFMTNNVYYIGQHTKYIVQKYIERPFLIYNTKFDIRQWFMITKLTPLEIWMYKECYLRFCTQPFALKNLHESVHLSNNSVQRKYVSYRDPTLPDQNMWDSTTFQQYLQTAGFPNVWEETIYPGMRDAIVSTMLAAQDTFDGPRKNWFEIYGADFMLSANIKDGPWLIEINENPAMDPSTKVTARLCPQMLRDVIKVVVDRRLNKNAPTGQWELIYRQNYSPSFGSVDLDVRGKKIARIANLEKNPKNLLPGPMVKAISPKKEEEPKKPEAKNSNRAQSSESDKNRNVAWKMEKIKSDKENDSQEEKTNLEVVGTGSIISENVKNSKIIPENVKKINDHFRSSYDKQKATSQGNSSELTKGITIVSAISERSSAPTDKKKNERNVRRVSSSQKPS